VASAAYGVWERNGRPHGRDLENWQQALREVRQSRVLEL
jgi:hypothetical protein